MEQAGFPGAGFVLLGTNFAALITLKKSQLNFSLPIRDPRARKLSKASTAIPPKNKKALIFEECVTYYWHVKAFSV